MISSSSTEELRTGCCLSASHTATAKNGRNESFTPSRSSKLAFERSRKRAIFVTSTSITVVNWALTCSDSTILTAITLRRRDIFTLVPRSGETETAAALVVAGADATGAGADATGAAGRASASTSSRRILPPIPVPVTCARLTPSSVASLRTSGVTYASAGCDTGAD